MTEGELSNYRKIQSEIRTLKEQKADLRNKMSIMKTPVSVLASSKYEPYQQHCVSVPGISLSDTAAFQKQDEKLQRLTLSIVEREKDALNEYEKINSFIESIQDSEMRQMITLYYLLNHSWQQVANRLGYSDEGSPRKKVDKYLSNSENSEL